jgi:glycosyltransferase involved in cell wall biosynthesis
MKIALIAPPFISVPPKNYGGTELFLARLTEGLQDLGHKVVLYTNGESTLDVEKRWLYKNAQWPIKGEIYDNLKDLNHTAWAVRDAAEFCDVIHLNNAPGLVCSRFTRMPFVYTVHHPHVEGLSTFYGNYPQVNYVTISDAQRSKEQMPLMRTIHHGLDASFCECLPDGPRDYLVFLGRIAPIKGTHLAIAAARQAGIPLKIAGEVQPMFREYFEHEIKPHLDGKSVEYIGEVDRRHKSHLLSGARALLFPIQWDEPFGLVMVEAMACGAPVLAMPRGAVPEVVKDGVSGYLCHSVEELAQRAADLHLQPEAVRRYVQENFSAKKMAGRYATLYAELLEKSGGSQAIIESERSVA